MRIWSLHPRHLDRQGLIACWRETLLAQAVLLGRTKGYTNHPQLMRFRTLEDPVAGIGQHLQGLAQEADVRGYRFDRSKILRSGAEIRLPVTTGQLALEWRHLLGKLTLRSPEKAQENHREAAEAAAGGPGSAPVPAPHPMMDLVEGPVEAWERAAPDPPQH